MGPDCMVRRAGSRTCRLEAVEPIGSLGRVGSRTVAAAAAAAVGGAAIAVVVVAAGTAAGTAAGIGIVEVGIVHGVGMIAVATAVPIAVGLRVFWNPMILSLLRRREGRDCRLRLLPSRRTRSLIVAGRFGMGVVRLCDP